MSDYKDMQALIAWKKMDAMLKQQENDKAELTNTPNNFVNRRNMDNQNENELASLRYMKLIRENMRKV